MLLHLVKIAKRPIPQYVIFLTACSLTVHAHGRTHRRTYMPTEGRVHPSARPSVYSERRGIWRGDYRERKASGGEHERRVAQRRELGSELEGCLELHSPLGV